MRKMARIRRLLSSVLAAGLLVTAIAVPQASAAADSDDGTSSYSVTYDYGLSSPDRLRIYRGTSLFGASITAKTIDDPVITTVSGYNYNSAASGYGYILADGTTITSLPTYTTTSSYLYSTSELRYLETTPISTGESTWYFSLPASGTSASTNSYIWLLERSTEGLTYAIASPSIRVSLLGSNGNTIMTSDTYSTASLQTFELTVTEPVYGVEFEISRSFSGAGNALVFGYYFLSSAKVKYSDTEYTSYYQDVVDGITSIDDNITNSTNSIIDNLLSIPGMIVDGILSLFVPSAEDLSGVYDDFTSLMEEKLGAIWQVGSIIGSFFEGLSTDDEVNSITFPGISFPMNGEVITIAASQTVQIVPDEIYNADWYDMIRLAVTAVLVFAWVMGMEKMLERMLSPDGRSED